MNRQPDTFTIAMKIQDKQIKFSIHFDDDQDVLFQKMVNIYPQCSTRREEVMEKLKNDLESRIKSSNVKICLKGVIQKYLDKTFYGKKDVTLSPEKNSSLEKSLSKNRLGYGSSRKSKENIQTPLPMTSSFMTNSKGSRKKGGQKSSKVRPKSSMTKQSPNEDVVKACQVIFQKTSQNDMKMMARNYLKEIGRLPQEDKDKPLIKRSPNKSAVIDETVELIDENEPVAQNSNKKQEQQSLIFNTTQQLRSPIEGINSTHQRKYQFEPNRAAVTHFNYDNSYIQPKSFRAHRYNYISSLQTTLQPSYSNYASEMGYIRGNSSHYRQRKFNYLE